MATALALQVILPRVFSVVLWYHLGFFVVSLAMLGTAVGAAFVLVRKRQGREVEPASPLPWAALSAFAVLLIVLRIPIEARDLLTVPFEAAKLFTIAALLAVPFCFLGAVFAAAMARGESLVSTTYASTFAGGAIGAVIGYFGMDLIGAPRALALVALLPLVPVPRRALVSSGLAAVILAVASFVAPNDLLPMRSAKHFPKLEERQVQREEWNAFSRVTFYDNPERHGLWDVAGRFSGALPQSIGIAIDAWAITSILHFAAPAEEYFFEFYPATLAYVGAKKGFQSLVIGAGGGVDVAAALHFGAGHVDAVEINPLIVNAVRGVYREFSGGLYDRPEVSVHVAEGRHFAANSNQLYDRIVLTGVDTFAATEAGAFALSENYLYTVEAMKDWIQRLAPGGILTFTRWWYEPPRQTLRLALTIERALRELGAKDPARQIIIGHTAMNSVTLVKNGEFTVPETEAVLTAQEPRGLELVHSPGMFTDDRFKAVFDDATREAFIAGWPYRIEPCTDDEPFFFETTKLSRVFRTAGDWIHDRLGGLEVLAITLLCLLLLGVPLAIWVSKRSNLSARLASAVVLLGLAYVSVEVPLMSRLALVLGHPARAVPVVLTGMLLGSGIGAYYSQRMPTSRTASAALAAAVLVIGILTFGHQELVDAVVGASDSARVCAVLLFLGMPAFALGIPFPLVLRGLYSNPIAIGPAIVLNGVASAIAGPLAAFLALELGFSAALGVAGVLYALAALALFQRSA